MLSFPFFTFMKRLLTALLLFLWPLPAVLAAKSRTMYETVPFPVSKGYPTSVTSIYIDDSGLAWLGSREGLYMLTNNGFIRYCHAPGTNDNYLPGNHVYKVFRDPSGILWVLTDGGLVGYHNRQEGRRLSRVTTIPQGIAVKSSCIAGTSVFFGGEGKVWRYDTSDRKFTLCCDLGPKTSFPIDGIFRQDDGSLLLFSANGHNMKILNPETGNVVSRIGEWSDKYFNAYLDQEGFLWVSRFREGVDCFDRLGRKVRELRVSDGFPSGCILSFVRKGNELWMGSDDGIVIYDVATGESEKLSVGRMNHPLPSSVVNTLACDRYGTIWAGCNMGGVFAVFEPKTDFYPFEMLMPSSKDGVSFFLQTPGESRIWLATNGSGLFCLDPESHIFKQCPSTAGLKIYTMVDLPSDRILLSCPNLGLRVYDKNTGELSLFPIDDDNNYYVKDGEGASLTLDKDGKVLVFSFGIGVYDPRTGSVRQFDSPISSEGMNLHALYGTQGRYFCSDNIVYHMDSVSPDRSTPIHVFEGRIRSGVAGVNNDLWMAVDNKVVRLNLSDGSAEELEFNFNSNPTSLLCDSSGRLWIGTRDKLYLYYSSTGNVLALGPSEAVPDNEYSPHAKLITSKGSVALGGSSGILRVPKSVYFSSGEVPSVEPLAVFVDGGQMRDFAKLNAPATCNNISIRLFAYQTNILRTVLFRIRVKGPDVDYSTTTSNPVVELNSPRHGHYTITASCNTTDGSWTTPVNVYSFKVKPKWFGTWWFILLAVLLSFGLFLLVNRQIHRGREYRREKKASEERYNFLLDISHELRTPLTLIIGPLSRLLRKNTMDNEDAVVVEDACHQAEKMKSLLNTFLVASRVDSDSTAEENREFVAFNQWLKDSVDGFNSEAARHDMEFRFYPDRNIGYVNMDQELCQIAITNIVLNVFRHNEPGKPIVVTTEGHRSEHLVRVNFHDSGLPLRDYNAGRILQNYFSETEERTGFSLGLAYAKNIMDRIGGRIGADNAKDGGVNFWCEIPADSAAFKSILDERSAEEVVRNSTILFVDDNADLAAYASDELLSTFKRVYFAINGNDAMRCINSRKVDLVVTDVTKPVVDGLALCRQIKQSEGTRHIHVIALADGTDEAGRQSVYPINADYYMQKPFEVVDLINVITKFLTK